MSNIPPQPAQPIGATVPDSVVGSAGAAASLTYAANPNSKHVIVQLIVSYSAAPTGGGLTITDAGQNILNIDIVGSGPTVITFDPPLQQLQLNQALVITLAAPGGAVVGKLNARHMLGY
jgi:hypothetical protein